MAAHKKTFFYKNGLSIVLILLFIISLAGQAVMGWVEYNKELEEYHVRHVRFEKYLFSGHFIETTFENWESEFLQMAIFVWLTIFLRQQGSSESKSLEEDEPVDRKPKRYKNAPWPVKKGGVWLAIYENSLTIAFVMLFLISFSLHAYGSLKDYNEERRLKNQPLVSMNEYVTESKLWFESFQNWQSEFIAVASIVIFTIFLRQKGSAQSKPVDAPYSETGNG